MLHAAEPLLGHAVQMLASLVDGAGEEEGAAREVRSRTRATLVAMLRAFEVLCRETHRLLARDPRVPALITYELWALAELVTPVAPPALLWDRVHRRLDLSSPHCFRSASKRNALDATCTRKITYETLVSDRLRTASLFETANAATWKRIHSGNFYASDLGDAVPLRVNIFVARLRYCYQRAMSKSPSSKCGCCFCDRLAPGSDFYAVEGVPSSEEEEDEEEAGADTYWRLAGALSPAAAAKDVNFCSTGCRRAFLRDATGATAVVGETGWDDGLDPSLRGCRRISAGFDAALRRNARAARDLRAAERDRRVHGAFPALDDATFRRLAASSTKSLNVDTAVLYAAHSLSESRSLCERRKVAPSVFGWRSMDCLYTFPLSFAVEAYEAQEAKGAAPVLLASREQLVAPPAWLKECSKNALKMFPAFKF